MTRLSISKAWDDSRPIMARDGRLMFIVALATVVLPGTILMTLDPAQTELAMEAQVDVREADPLVSFLGFLFMFVNIIGSIAISYLALYRGASVGDALRRGMKRLLTTLGAALLFVIPIALLVVLVMQLGLSPETRAALEAGETPMLSGSEVMLVLALMAFLIWVAVRMSLFTPVIAAEDKGPVAVIRRAWALSGGHFWRLFGFFLLLVIGALVFMGVVGIIAGLAITLVLGEAEPLTLAALLLGLVASLAQAAVTIVYSTVLARIYLQLAGRPADPAVGVPPVSAEPVE
ncbi:hypothetical protein [Sphingomicrobium aestuariivivum]|uniref:hypothetical protein n=1 Tax=Sphingomicrobium aestuariivivum TaxID=1582356 RepID=UPI001FD6A0A4|nr:hypothetical protein [Sphingomicrobium aestuariivivum]MCJ8190212.1 hypothetical protein [Sphingomicrobium aestuariivivum]